MCRNSKACKVKVYVYIVSLIENELVDYNLRFMPIFRASLHEAIKL